MPANKNHDPALRSAIIAEMKRKKAKDRQRWEKHGEDAVDWHERTWGHCTWWFKFKIPKPTAVIRRELDRMERDGLVMADRSSSNNTKWRLVDHDNQ